jgi:hypothetical protein
MLRITATWFGKVSMIVMPTRSEKAEYKMLGRLHQPLFRDGGPTHYASFPSRRDQQFQSIKTIR